MDTEVLPIAGERRRAHAEGVEVLLGIAVERLAGLVDVDTAPNIHLYFGERVERVSLGRESTPESTDGVAIGALDPVRDAIPLLTRQRCVRRDGAVLVRSPGHGPPFSRSSDRRGPERC